MHIHCTEKRGDLECVTLDQSFKLIQEMAWHNSAGWYWVLYAYCLWKETVFKVVFSRAVGLELKFVGGSGYFLLMSGILVRINGHNIVGNFIKHRDSVCHTSLFESLPIQVTFHVRYAACVMVSTRYKACCTLSNSSLFLLVCGDHTVEHYSKFNLTIALYAFSFAVSFQTFRFLRRNPSNLLALPVMLHMWVFHVRFLESVTPKYLASLTSSWILVCPFTKYMFTIGVLGDLVMNMELHFPGWNSIPHVSSHSSRWCRSCCNMSRSCCECMVLYSIVIPK